MKDRGLRRDTIVSLFPCLTVLILGAKISFWDQVYIYQAILICLTLSSRHVLKLTAGPARKCNLHGEKRHLFAVGVAPHGGLILQVIALIGLNY